MSTPLGVIEAERDTLLRALEANRTQIKQLQQQVVDRQRDVHDIEVQLRLLNTLSDKFSVDEDEAEEVHLEDGAPGPSEAVLALLLQHPQGLTSEGVAEALEGARINTASRNKRRLLFNTLHNLSNRGSVAYETVDGKKIYYHAESPQGKEARQRREERLTELRVMDGVDGM